MSYLVEALDTYKKACIEDKELKKIPEKGEQFNVSKERLDVLLGNNEHNLVFVKVIKELKDSKKD